MHQQHLPAYYTREKRFNDRFPLGIVAVLAIIQMLTTFAIIGLEIGHVIINIRLTNLFVGIWASVPFTILWFSMFATVCCCRRRSCATHAVIQNCISLIFACILVGINIAFLCRPNHCFFSEGICYNLAWETDISLPFECFNGNSDNCEHIRLALIKAQLAVGVIMAITCLIYLILYCTISSRVSRADRRQIPAAADAVMVPVYQQAINYPQQSHVNPPHLYQPSAPVMISAFGNYVPSNPHPTIYPQISNDRF